MPTKRSPHRRTSSSSSDDIPEVYERSNKPTLSFSTAPPRGSFRYLSLVGESDTDDDAELSGNVSGIVDRPKTASTPMGTGHARPRVSFGGFPHGEPSAIKQPRHKKMTSSGKENLPFPSPQEKSEARKVTPTKRNAGALSPTSRRDAAERETDGESDLRAHQRRLTPTKKSNLIRSPSKSRGRETRNTSESEQSESDDRMSPLQRRRTQAENVLPTKESQFIRPPSKPKRGIPPKHKIDRSPSKPSESERGIPSRPPGDRRDGAGRGSPVHKPRPSLSPSKSKERAAVASGHDRQKPDADRLTQRPATSTKEAGAPVIQRTRALGASRPTESSSRRKSTPKKRRKNQNLNILREIRSMQKTTNLLIRRAPFMRVVKEIADNISQRSFRWQGQAIAALQESAEAALVNLFEKSNLCCLHAHRVTLKPEDMHLACRLMNIPYC